MVLINTFRLVLANRAILDLLMLLSQARSSHSVKFLWGTTQPNVCWWECNFSKQRICYVPIKLPIIVKLVNILQLQAIKHPQLSTASQITPNCSIDKKFNQTALYSNCYTYTWAEITSDAINQSWHLSEKNSNCVVITEIIRI